MAIKAWLVFLVLGCYNLAIGQIKVPAAGDNFYVYSTKMDRAILENTGQQFYTIDFPCLSKLSLLESEEPRIDYELTNESTGESTLINLVDGNIMLKGFRIMDPYFQLSEKYIQLIKGIPLVNLDKVEDFSNTGSENYYLEYKVSDLPEQMQNWAYINDYDKLRIKIGLEYKTAYKGVEAVGLLGGEECHKIYISYSQKVTEIKMKNDGWVAVELSEVPLSDQYFIDFHTEYHAYHQNADPFGALKVYEQPELSVQYVHSTKEKSLPICVYSDEQIYVYPNPSFGKLNVRMINTPVGEYSFDLYNIIGFKVWSTSLQNGEQDLFHLELPDLEKGIYLYSIKDRNGRNMQARRLTIIEY